MKIIGRLIGTPKRPTCRQVGLLLQTYLDSELDHERADRVAAHLEDCRRCGLEAETYRALRASLRDRRTPMSAAPIERLRAFGAQLADGDAPNLPNP